MKYCLIREHFSAWQKARKRKLLDKRVEWVNSCLLKVQSSERVYANYAADCIKLRGTDEVIRFTRSEMGFNASLLERSLCVCTPTIMLLEVGDVSGRVIDRVLIPKRDLTAPEAK